MLDLHHTLNQSLWKFKSSSYYNIASVAVASRVALANLTQLCIYFTVNLNTFGTRYAHCNAMCKYKGDCIDWGLYIVILYN